MAYYVYQDAHACIRLLARVHNPLARVHIPLARVHIPLARVHNPHPQSVQRLIQLCIGSWWSVVGSSDVVRTLHTSARPGAVIFDPRIPATPPPPPGSPQMCTVL